MNTLPHLLALVVKFTWSFLWMMVLSMNRYPLLLNYSHFLGLRVQVVGENVQWKCP